MEKKYFKKADLVQNAEFWFMLFLTVFFHLKPKKVLLNDFILNIIGIIKSVNPKFHKKTSFMRFIILECLTIFSYFKSFSN
jgi:hypothetical protein